MSTDEFPAGSTLPATGDRASERSISDQVLAEVLAVIDSAEKLLGSSELPDSSDIDDLPAASTALNAIWNGVRASIRGDRATANRLAGTDDLLPLLLATRDAETSVGNERARRQSSMVGNIREALARFHQMRSVSELIESTPNIVCTLGFDRAIVSRIDESTWITDAVGVEGDKEWADCILQAGRENPQRLVPNLFETEIVRRKLPMVVRNVQQEARVHRAVADASLSRSYVAAPVMPRAQVIGFLHADRYFHKGDLTEFDRDVLAIFGEGFGYALERAILLDRLGELRTRVVGFAQGLAADVSTTFDEQLTIGERTEDTAEPREHSTAAHPAFNDWPSDSRLTRREVDVLRLMAAGDTNHRIANKLIISEGTVKSHVKHILRKLGAANRAEAVSIWLHGER